MTRGRPAEAPDLHDRFAQWLQAGAPGEPSRDVAIHGAHCPACRQLVAAWDRLALVDTGRAPMPPSRSVVLAPSGWLPRPRAMATAAAGIVVLGIGAWIGASAMRPSGIGQAPGTPTPDQGVLGGFGAGGSATPSAKASLTLDGSPSPSETATATATVGPDTPTPGETQAGQTPFQAASPRPVTPAPTVRPPAATQPPNPTQTISPTQPPTLPPTLPPTATPPPPTASPTPTTVPTATQPPSLPPTPAPTEPASAEPSQAP